VDVEGDGDVHVDGEGRRAAACPRSVRSDVRPPDTRARATTCINPGAGSRKTGWKFRAAIPPPGRAGLREELAAKAIASHWRMPASFGKFMWGLAPIALAV
jgi:hypothetical protein